MKHPLVEKLEKRLLPEFEEIAERIRQEIPNVKVHVESNSLGFDEYLGHGFAISCLVEAIYEPDNVALCIVISNLVSIPEISSYVCWGHPSGYLEAEYSDELIKVSDEVLEELYQDLPRLYEALFEALRRRKPKDLC